MADGLSHRNPVPSASDRILSFVGRLRPGQLLRSKHFGDLIGEYAKNGSTDLDGLICECMAHGEVDALGEILKNEDVSQLCVRREAHEEGMSESGWKALLLAMTKSEHWIRDLKLSGGCYDFAAGGSLLSMLASMPSLESLSFQHVAATGAASLLTCAPLNGLRTLDIVAGTESGAAWLPLAILRGGCQVRNLCIEEEGGINLDQHARLGEEVSKQERLVSLRLRTAPHHAEKVVACYEPLLQGGAPLERLDLSHCAMGPQHCDLLLEGLQNKKTLTTLLLKDCLLGAGADGAFPKIRFRTLGNLPRLCELDFSSNGLGDDALMLILRVLEGASTGLLHVRLNDNGAGPQTMTAAASLLAKQRGLLSLCLWRDDVTCPDEHLQRLAQEVEKHASLLLLRVNADAQNGPNARTLIGRLDRNGERLMKTGLRLVFEDEGRRLPNYLFEDCLSMTAAHLAVRDAVNLSSINKAARGWVTALGQEQRRKILLASKLPALDPELQELLGVYLTRGTVSGLSRVVHACMKRHHGELLHDVLSTDDGNMESLCVQAAGVHEWSTLMEASALGPLRIRDLRLVVLEFTHATIPLLYEVLSRMPALRTLTLAQVELEASYFPPPECPPLPSVKTLNIRAGQVGPGVSPLMLALLGGCDPEVLEIEEEGAILEHQHADIGLALCAKTKLGTVRLLIERIEAFHHYFPFVQVAPLVSLDVSDCGIGAGRCNRLLELLQHKTTLTSLCLRNCKLHVDRKTARLQVQCFQSMTGLRELDLGKNYLLDDTLTPLISVLEAANIRLLELNLDDSFYGEITIRAMASWLAKNPMLRSVGFIRAVFPEDGPLEPVAAALENNTSLLWFDTGEIPREHPSPFSLAIDERLRRNRSHLKLSLMEGGARVVLRDLHRDVAHHFAELAAPSFTMRDAQSLGSINRAARGAGSPEFR
jgi:hypothetical protein